MLKSNIRVVLNEEENSMVKSTVKLQKQTSGDTCVVVKKCCNLLNTNRSTENEEEALMLIGW